MLGLGYFLLNYKKRPKDEEQKGNSGGPGGPNDPKDPKNSYTNQPPLLMKEKNSNDKCFWDTNSGKWVSNGVQITIALPTLAKMTECAYDKLCDSLLNDPRIGMLFKNNAQCAMLFNNRNMSHDQ
jgi:hypothetical protein